MKEGKVNHPSHHAYEFPSDEEDRLGDLFKQLDVNGDGRIDVHDLSEGLKKLNIPQVPGYAEVRILVFLRVKMEIRFLKCIKRYKGHAVGLCVRVQQPHQMRGNLHIILLLFTMCCSCLFIFGFIVFIYALGFITMFWFFIDGNMNFTHEYFAI